MKHEATMKFPKVSFVICTLNCREYAERCFKSIHMQDYPKNKLEIIVVDSYSTDGTIGTAKKFGARVILTKKRGYMEGKGMPKSIGCEKARGEIIIIIDSDNRLVEKDWIKKMIYPLITNKDIDFCICRMAVVKEDILLNRYLSLVGTDPFAIYCSIDPQISLGKLKLTDNGEYYSYNINPKNFFIVGGYCLAIRKKTLKEIGGYSRDVDVVYSLAKIGKANFAIPKETHLHHLITVGYRDFLKKKMKWVKYYFSNREFERDLKWYSGVFGKFGKIRFVWEVVKNLFFFPEFFVSIKMLVKDKRKAWIIHPFLVWLTTFVYILSYFKK